MDVTDRPRYEGTGIDSMLRQKLSDMADEEGARNTRVAIAVPVKQIIAIFHEVFGNVPHVPDYDQFAFEAQRWGGLGTYSPGEVPEPQAEVGVKLVEDSVHVVFETNDSEDAAELTLAQAEQFFLAGLAAALEGKRRYAERPALGISDADAETALARRGIVVGAVEATPTK